MVLKVVVKSPSLIGAVIKRKTRGNVLYQVQVSLILVGSKKIVRGPRHGCWVMAKKDLELAQTASNHREMDEILRALRDGSKRGRVAREQIAPGTVKEKGAMEEPVKEHTGTAYAKASNDAPFNLSGDKEDVLQWYPGAARAVVSVVTGSQSESMPGDRLVGRVDEIQTCVKDDMGRLRQRVSAHVMEWKLKNRLRESTGWCERDVCSGDREILPSEKIWFDRQMEPVQRPSLSSSGDCGEVLPGYPFRRQVDELVIWVIDHMGQLPKQRSADAMERALAKLYYKFKFLCTREKRIRGRLARRKLLPCEKMYFDRVEQVVSPYKAMRAVPSDAFMQRVDEIKTWVIDHMGLLPKANSTDATERTLAARYVYLKTRCMRDICTRQGMVRLRKCMPCEKAYFDSIEEVLYEYKPLGQVPSDSFMQRVDEIRTWVVCHMGRLPKQTSGDAMERSLALRYAYFKMRCSRSLCTSEGVVRARKCLPCERMYFDRINEVLLA